MTLKSAWRLNARPNLVPTLTLILKLILVEILEKLRQFNSDLLTLLEHVQILVLLLDKYKRRNQNLATIGAMGKLRLKVLIYSDLFKDSSCKISVQSWLNSAISYWSYFCIQIHEITNFSGCCALRYRFAWASKFVLENRGFANTD